MKKTDRSIIVYTDGSSLGNPGPGGFGCVIGMLPEKKILEQGGFSKKTTNNQMELTAIITALEFIRKHYPVADIPITIYTDSRYAINGITRWIYGWEKNNWITTAKQPVINSELWQQFLPYIYFFKKLNFVHVRGHTGVPGNERCDGIATSFAQQKKVTLFSGDHDTYPIDIFQTPTISKVIENNSPRDGQRVSKKDTTKKKVYAYVSCLDNIVKIHTTWDECKTRVHGKPAQYKKVFSQSEQDALVKLWKK